MDSRGDNNKKKKNESNVVVRKVHSSYLWNKDNKNTMTTLLQMWITEVLQAYKISSSSSSSSPFIASSKTTRTSNFYGLRYRDLEGEDIEIVSDLDIVFALEYCQERHMSVLEISLFWMDNNAMMMMMDTREMCQKLQELERLRREAEHKAQQAEDKKLVAVVCGRCGWYVALVLVVLCFARHSLDWVQHHGPSDRNNNNNSSSNNNNNSHMEIIVLPPLSNESAFHESDIPKS